jgi:hypothetical protein
MKGSQMAFWDSSASSRYVYDRRKALCLFATHDSFLEWSCGGQPPLNPTAG